MPSRWMCCVILVHMVQSQQTGSGCDSTQLSSPNGLISSGILTSTQSPDVGPLCKQWFIQGTKQNGSHITLRFTYFSIDSDNEGVCLTNWLQLGPVPNQTLCGPLSTQDVTYTSDRSHMWLEYRVAPGNSCFGFLLLYNTTVIGDTKLCTADQLKCGNGHCISRNLHCNGIDDCGDGSDEVLCLSVPSTTMKPELTTVRACDPSSFTCEDPAGRERCFPITEICNGQPVCKNHTDEKDCEKQCKFAMEGPIGFFTSPNFPHSYPWNADCEWYIHVKLGYTITLHVEEFNLEPRPSTDFLSLYDGSSKDSPRLAWLFGSDQKSKKFTSKTNRVFAVFHSNGNTQLQGFNITFQQRGSCLPDQVPCITESNCYSKDTERCDGFWDCPLHGQDEKECNKCAKDHFSCGSGLECYTERDRCNGMSHCFNKKDEMNCGEDRCGTHNGTFLCRNLLCIYESWRCDGANDCGDNSDEMMCPVSNKVIIAAVLGSLICGTLLLIALGCMCKLHALRLQDEHQNGSSRYVSPLTRVQEEILSQRSAPPPYQEAMVTSRPYDEARQEFLQQMEASGGVGNLPHASMEISNQDAAMVQVNASSGDIQTHRPQLTPSLRLESNSQGEDEGEDDLLIDISDNNGLIDPSDPQTVRILLSTDITARWRRARPKVTCPPASHRNVCSTHQGHSGNRNNTSVSLVMQGRDEECNCTNPPPPPSPPILTQSPEIINATIPANPPDYCDIGSGCSHSDPFPHSIPVSQSEANCFPTSHEEFGLLPLSDCDTNNTIENCGASANCSTSTMESIVPLSTHAEDDATASLSSCSSCLLDDLQNDIPNDSTDTHLMLA